MIELEDLPDVTTGLPTVVQAVAAVSADVGAVAKDGESGQGYKFRRVDDVINALHGPLSHHGLVIVPYVTSNYSEPMDRKNWTRTVLEVEFRVYGPAGDSIVAKSVGEAHNNSDKGPGVAMSYAYKTAMCQLFSLPTDDPKMDNEYPDEPEEPEEVEEDEETKQDRLRLIKAIGESDKATKAKMRDWLKKHEISLRHPLDFDSVDEARIKFAEFAQSGEQGDSSDVTPPEEPPTLDLDKETESE